MMDSKSQAAPHEGLRSTLEPVDGAGAAGVAGMTEAPPGLQADGPSMPQLARSLGLLQLTLLGIGATIGSGIFVVLDQAAALAGPAVIVSFLIAGLTAALTALCYAELASKHPGAGSAYTFARLTFGELAAFLVGACLVLEYAVSGAAVAVGFGKFVDELIFDLAGVRLPPALAQPPTAGGLVNLPAVALVMVCASLLLRGVSESSTVNGVLVVIKLAVLGLFIAIALSAAQTENFTPFAPAGVAGVGSAAALVFFSFIGLDAVSTAGAEAKNPRRSLPLAIILSLLVVTAVYVLVAVAAVAARPAGNAPLEGVGMAAILRAVTGGGWASVLLSVGAMLSIFSVTLIVIYGQTRILFSMSRDRLLPSVFERVTPRTRIPALNTLFVSAVIALLAGFAPLDLLTNLTSMGTLVAFAAVSAAVLISRRSARPAPDVFLAPIYPWLPLGSLACCLYLVAELPLETFGLFAAWMAAAATLYLAYSRPRRGRDPRP